jgi:hypothetical protein
MLLFRKVTLLTYGLILIPMKAYAAVKGFIIARQIIGLGLDAKEQAMAIKKALANAAVTTSYGAMGIAADVTGTKAALMWAKIGGPITLILAGLALVTAAIVAIVAGINAAIEKAQRKATVATTNLLRQSTRDATLTATETANIWSKAVTRATDGIGNASEKQASIVRAGVKTSLAALREIDEYERNYIEKAGTNRADPWYSSGGGTGSGLDNFLKGSKVVKSAFKEYTDASIRLNDLQDDLRESVVGLNKSFATLAKENIYNALGALRAFAKVTNLTDGELSTLIQSDKALEDQLVKHAESIGYVVKDQDGLINQTKLLNVALMRNGYRARLITLEYEKFEKQVNAVIESFGNVSDAIEQNMTIAEDSTKKFDFSGFIKSLKGQGDAALNYAKNMDKLRKTLGKENADLFQDLVNQGQSAAGLVDSLVGKSTEKIKEYVSTARERARQLEEARRIMMAFSDFRVIDKALENIGASAFTRSWAKSQANAGETVIELQAKLGLTDKQMIDASKQIKTGVAQAGQTMEISATWNKESLGQLKKQFEGEMGEFVLSVKEAKADGGLVGNNSKIKGTLGAKGYYNGGLVFGQGGPRQDRIPAYLSNGEYVINAAATAKNLELLKSINSGKQVAAGGVNISVYAAPGMNEQDVANIVSARLTHELYKGMTI